MPVPLLPLACATLPSRGAHGVGRVPLLPGVCQAAQRDPVERPSERERLRQDFGGDAAHSQGQCLSSNCIEQITDWSLCSRSCGPGVSTRSSNQNWACRPQTQTRLCQVRLCQPTAVQRSRSQEGRMSHQQVMMIESCSCHHYNCPQSPLTAYRRAIPWL
ncbi:hypothetical protein J4Q44_G00079010 [Coregonus suidteri]|uniref:CCN TSP1 domain-containing protein n=1 Tax=Coregonus suidteri TaxID=861788 RepID=A0AAN8LY11_9TELE